MTIEEINPKYPISVAIFYNFICKGVGVFSYCLKINLIFPIQLKSPTTITSILP